MSPVHLSLSALCLCLSLSLSPALHSCVLSEWRDVYVWAAALRPAANKTSPGLRSLRWLLLRLLPSATPLSSATLGPALHFFSLLVIRTLQTTKVMLDIFYTEFFTSKARQSHLQCPSEIFNLCFHQ